MADQPKHFVLLTGAGFSANWNGLVASELFDDLLSRVGPDLRGILWDAWDKGEGFEGALARLQRERVQVGDPDSIQRLNELQGAVLAVFLQMDTAWAWNFTFETARGLAIKNFLARFDVIFTLNQDTLLERQYLEHVSNLETRRWSGISLPGLRSMSPPARPDFTSGQEFAALKTVATLTPESLREGANVQPYYKLHGSWNWREAENQGLMIIGGEKTAAIAASPLLAEYFKRFRERLNRPATRLMVIGYGFLDAHINEAILAGIEGGLEIFVMDPLGAEVMDRRRWDPLLKGKTVGIGLPEDLLIYRKGLVGTSRRPLSLSLSDAIARANVIERFFNPK